MVYGHDIIFAEVDFLVKVCPTYHRSINQGGLGWLKIVRSWTSLIATATNRNQSRPYIVDALTSKYHSHVYNHYQYILTQNHGIPVPTTLKILRPTPNRLSFPCPAFLILCKAEVLGFAQTAWETKRANRG